MNQENKMISTFVETDDQTEKEKPFVFTKFTPNGEIVCEKSFETLDEALELYEKELGWWYQGISMNGKIIKHNLKRNQTEVES